MRNFEMFAQEMPQGTKDFIHKLDYSYASLDAVTTRDVSRQGDNVITFAVELPAVDGAGLGVLLDDSDGRTLLITSEPEAGSRIHVWNKQCDSDRDKKRKAVEVNDRIIEVNGFQQSSAVLNRYCKQPNLELKLTLEREVIDQCALELQTDTSVVDKENLCLKAMNAARSVAGKTLNTLAEFVRQFCKQLKDFGTVWWNAAGTGIQWGLPFILVALSFVVVGLTSRIATIYYIRYMRRLEQLNGVSQDHFLLHVSQDPEKWDSNVLMAPWLETKHFDYPQKLQDIFASWFKDPLDIPTWMWDVIGMTMPFLCISTVIVTRDVYMWGKTSACVICLNLGKAFCSIATVLPDAQGWESCKARLTGSEGMSGNVLKELNTQHFEWMAEAHASDDFLQVLLLEATGSHYCGDMLYSVPTFLTFLYALGFHDLLWKHWTWGQEHPMSLRLLMWVFVVPFCILSSAVILAARIHYSIDVFIAIVLTVLLYRFEPLERACRWWAGIASPLGPAKIETTNQANLDLERERGSNVGFVLGLAKLCASTGVYIVGLYTNIEVILDLRDKGYVNLMAIYVTCLLVMALVFIIVGFLDEDLKRMPLPCRMISSILLGATHLIYVMKRFCIFLKGGTKQKEEFFVIRIIRAGIMSAPIAAIQIYSICCLNVPGNSSEVLMRYLNVLISLQDLGDAVANGDGGSTSVLKELVLNTIWFVVLEAMRICEVTSRILMLVIIQYFAELRAPGDYLRYTAFAILFLDVFVTACLVLCSGVVQRIPAATMFALASLGFNVNLFQKDDATRRVADIICSFRSIEFMVFIATASYYFKRVPGGGKAILEFFEEHAPIACGFAASFAMYVFLLVPWLGIRRVYLPQEWHDQVNEEEEVRELLCHKKIEALGYA